MQMDPRDFRRWKTELQGIAKGLDGLSAQIQVQLDRDEKYLRAVVSEILSRTKEHANGVLNSRRKDNELVKSQVLELQKRIKEYLRGLDFEGRPLSNGMTSAEAFIAQLRQAAAEVPVKMMTLDPSGVHTAVKSFLPTFNTSYGPPAAAAAAAVITISDGMELECFVGSKIDENAEFWVHPTFSAALERELLNAAILCRSRHLASGLHASFAARPDDVQAGLHCWALVDGDYCRACVESVKAEGDHRAVLVRDLDYGASRTVRCEDLFPFTKHDRDIAFQAFKCHLAGSFPARLSNDARWAFADAVQNKPLMVKVLSAATGVDRNPPAWDVIVKEPASDTTVNAAIMERASLEMSQQRKTHTSTDIRLENPEAAEAGGIKKVVAVITSQATSSAAAVSSVLHSSEQPTAEALPSSFSSSFSSSGIACPTSSMAAVARAAAPPCGAAQEAPAAASAVGAADGESAQWAAESGPLEAQAAAAQNLVAAAAGRASAHCEPAADGAVLGGTSEGGSTSSLFAVDGCGGSKACGAAGDSVVAGSHRLDEQHWPAEAQPAARGRAAGRDPVSKRRNQRGLQKRRANVATAANEAVAHGAAGEAAAPATGGGHPDAAMADAGRAPLGRGQQQGQRRRGWPEAAALPLPPAGAEGPAPLNAAAGGEGHRRPRITCQSKATLYALLSSGQGRSKAGISESKAVTESSSPDEER